MTSHDLTMAQLLVEAGMPKSDAVDVVTRIVEPYEQQITQLTRERDAYRAMLCDLLASAHPHPAEHPTMTKQWGRARALLKDGPP